MSIFRVHIGTWARWGAALAVVGIVTHATLSVAAPDPKCLRDAVNRRADQVKIAYNDYAKEMVRITDRLTKDESDALDITGDSGQNQLSRAQTNYTNDSNEATRTITYKLQQAWNDYSLKVSTCGYASSAPMQSYQYGYGQQQPYWNGYPYGGYNNTYQQYPYGGYGWYGGMQGAYYCPQVVLTALPAGCGYERSRDERGCDTYEVRCRNVDTDNRPSCYCAQNYSPVCGRDGHVYTNACYAQCADTGVAYGGVCR